MWAFASGLLLVGLVANAMTQDACKTKSKTAPHEEYCDKYYACVGDNKQQEVRDCPNGLSYTGFVSLSSPFKVCNYNYEVDCSTRPKRSVGQRNDQADPCQAKSRVVGDVTYCDRFWECIGGQPELFDCPNGLVFAGRNRGVADNCDYPWRSNYCDGKQHANPPIGTEHCDWLYGIFGHETSCTRYWTCWNGTATELQCIGGLLYNEDTHSCDWPENVPGCQKHPLCKDDANGNVPLGKSCNRYWQCQGGYPRLQRCPAMLVFDKRSLRCVLPPTEDCDVPTTIAPPLEEGGNNADGSLQRPSRPRFQEDNADLGSQQQPQQQASNQQGRFRTRN